MYTEDVDFPTKLVHSYHWIRKQGWYGAIIAWLCDVLLKLGVLLLIFLAFWWLFHQSRLVLTVLLAVCYIGIRLFDEYTKRQRRKLIGQDKTVTRRIHDALTLILTRFKHKTAMSPQLLELHYDINESPHFLILSDLHRGAGNPADDFQKCYFV